jgi:hypothetical protein
VQPEKFAQHTPNAVAPHRPPNLSAHSESEAKSSRHVPSSEDEEDEVAGEDFAPLIVADAEALALEQAAALGPV